MKGGALRIAGVLILIVILFAGCLERAGNLLDPEEIDLEEPHKRLRGLGGTASVGQSCSYADTNLPGIYAGRDCFNAVGETSGFICSPAQLWLPDFESGEQHGLTFENVSEAKAAQRDIEPPDNDVYLYCEYNVDWDLWGRSLMPESEFRMVVETNDAVYKDECIIPVNSHCGFDISYKGNFTIYQDNEVDPHEVRGNLEIEWFEPLLNTVKRSTLNFESNFEPRVK